MKEEEILWILQSSATEIQSSNLYFRLQTVIYGPPLWKVKPVETKNVKICRCASLPMTGQVSIKWFWDLEFDGRKELHKPITITSQSLVQSEQLWQMFFYQAFVLSRRSEANSDNLPRVVSLESTPAGPENHSVKNWKGLEAWSREKVGFLSHMAWVSPRDRIVFYWCSIRRIFMPGPNKQDSISKPELKIWQKQLPVTVK